MADQNDFYEEDEPVNDVIRAFEHGQQGTTEVPPVSPPSRGRTLYFDVSSAQVTEIVARPFADRR
jgi:hypothetical protein